MVERAALIQKLNQGMECGLVLLCAPAGYGKTTLISAWLHQLKQKNTWLTLDKQDDDPIRFLTYLAAALRKIDPTISEVLEIQLQTCPLPIIENCLTPVINRINEIELPFWLVLDDYHVINHRNIHQTIRFLINHRPHNLHLIIATRADPPLPLSKYRAKSVILELRLAELRFSEKETVEFFNQVVGMTLSSGDITILYNKTEGWAAGLLMAGLSLQTRMDPSEYIQSFFDEDRYIMDFLFDEIFSGQSKEIQDFLLKTSILERLCGGLCDAVTAQDDSQFILETLERNNQFLIPLDDRHEWYRYHHLFRDLLINRANQLVAADVSQLHSRAGNWFRDQRLLEKAIQHFLLAQDFEIFATIIEKNIQNFDLQNQQSLLSAWLAQIPQPILIKHPWLCVYRAWGDYWSGKRGKEEEWLKLAEQSIQDALPDQKIEKQHIEGHIAAARAHIALIDEDVPRAKTMGETALQLLPIDDIRRSEAAIALAGVYWALGDVKNTQRSFEMAVDTALKINYTSMAAGCMGYIGIQLIKQGKLDEASFTFDEGLKIATLPDGNETPMAGFLNFRLGDLWRERNNFRLAEQYLTKGLEQSQYLGQPDILVDATICCGRFQLAIGSLEQANYYLQKSEETAEKTKVDPWISCWLNDLRIRIWYSEKNTFAINHWINTCGLSFDQPLSYQHDLNHQNLARAFIARSSLANAYKIEESVFRLLDRLLYSAKQAGWVYEQIKILIMEAISVQIQVDSQKALKPLLEALVLAEPSGYQRVFIDEGERMHALLGQLERQIRMGNLTLHNVIKEYAVYNRFENIQKYLHVLLQGFISAEPQFEPISHQTKGRIKTGKIPIDPLTPREIDVIKLLALGYPDKRTAEYLFITQGTVHKHLKNIYSKLDAHCRTEAVARAQALKILPFSQ
jgi:LuxR family maltose regulon positive regulatory protein